MFCESCGHSLPEDSRFCENCGSALEDTAPAPSPPRYSAGPTPPEPVGSPAPKADRLSALPILLVAVLAVGIGAGALLIPRLTRSGDLAQELRDTPPIAASDGVSQTPPNPSGGGEQTGQSAPSAVLNNDASSGAENPPRREEPEQTQSETSALGIGQIGALPRPWEEPGYNPEADIEKFVWITEVETVPPEGSALLSEISQVEGLWSAMRIDENNDSTWMEVEIAAYDEALHGGSGLFESIVVTMASYYITDGADVIVLPPEGMYNISEANFQDGILLLSPGTDYETQCLMWEIDDRQYGIVLFHVEDIIMLMR